MKKINLNNNYSLEVGYEVLRNTTAKATYLTKQCLLRSRLRSTPATHKKNQNNKGRLFQW